MKISCLLFLSLLSLLSLTASVQGNGHEGRRLISLSETHSEWMTEEEIMALIQKRIGFIDVTEEQGRGGEDREVVMADPLPNQPIHKVYVDNLMKQLSAHTQKATLEVLTNYTTRYYTSATGADAAKYIASLFEDYAKDRDDIKVELFTHTWAQPSVIATIPGMGEHKDQFVVIGAHEDSVGTSSTARAPGADDDGSGVVGVLDIFRVLVAAGHYPDRTLKFMTYAGEEAGLLGSNVIATAFKDNKSDVYAVLQLDMTGYGGMDTNVGVVTDNTNEDLNAFVRLLIDTYSLLNWVDTKCGYGCSDHASWTRQGFRASFPFETPFNVYNPNIHTANDLISKIDMNRCVEFAKIGLGFMVELGGLTIRP